jgi:adenine-specific DNA methylase
MMVRRLIETDEMPIGRISEHSRKDQNVRKGHLHTLHVWWATRPLAACRAVLMATLLPDPADPYCPSAFINEARRLMHSWADQHAAKASAQSFQRLLRIRQNPALLDDPLELRATLLDFIADFAAWENSNKQFFVKTACQLVAVAHPDDPPLVVDPFAGIGSIPFEALRIGADAFAADLNPVAVLLNKVALEYLPTYGPRLAEAVRKWGEWVRARAIEELRPFYPLEPDGSEPLAYLWARTIRCEGPGCGAEVPLVGLLWLSRKEKHRVALRYRGDRTRKEVVFEIFQPKSESEVQPPIVKRFAATCPVCGYTTPYARVREQIRARRGGTRDARMIAVITLRPDGSRGFRLATEQDVAVARRAAEELARREREHKGPLPLVPDEPAPEARGPGASRAFSVRKWGMETWGDLFTPRQALALCTFVRLVREAHGQVLQETGDAGFARAVATCLAVAVSNLVHYASSISIWAKDGMISAFVQGSGLPMRPDFAEADPLMPKLVGGFDYALDQVAQVLGREGGQGFRPGTVRQGSATAFPLPDGFAPYVVTDPPYYDAVPYASLSDFCYVWLRRMLYDLHPDLFRWPLTPKAEECIMDPGPPPPGEPEKTKEFFETTMERALAECRRILRPDGVAVVLFAHKGTAGWEAMLNALIRAGWTVTNSWPIETERGARMRAKNSAVLASSVFLVCRPRDKGAGVGDWRRVLEEMHRKVAAWLPRLEQEGIHGADAIFACIGPALEVYSRYERVETAGGQVIPLGDVRDSRGQVVQRGYLSYVWEAVAREALKLIFPEADPAGFEEDARVTAMWLWTLRARANGPTPEEAEMLEDEEEPTTGRKRPAGYALPYDDARLILQALGAHEESLRRPGGILEVKGNIARLVAVAERRRRLFGTESQGGRPRRRRGGQPTLLEEAAPELEPEVALAPGASTLDRLHQAMLLFADGQSAALRRFLVDEGVGKDDRFWRLADALSRLYPINSQEKRWVDGLLARRKVLGL